MTSVVFVRHGESTGNAGVPTHDLSSMALTEKGHRQAATLANEWTIPPTHVATSSYLRTKLTAQPTLARFPMVVQEVWPMEEFTYLEPSRWNGTSRTERLPYIEAYWRNSDPVHRDGPGAESFTDLLTRVRVTLDRCAQLPIEARIVAFSHGQFMQAVRLSVMFPRWTAERLMAYFWPFNQKVPVLNVECIELSRGSDGWALVSSPAGVRRY